ncbi:MAG: hypothetical protein OSJ71_04225 [Acetatifactor sp.]|nr:hypothetical protein [Acetatifactor sp.]
MAITIYTYSNPYKIDKEPYWASIQNCFHLCVSQTLANGLCDQYREFFQGKLTTIKNFVNVLYRNWESDVFAISQRAAIDNVIDYLDFSLVAPGTMELSDVIGSLKRNRNSVCESIRTMFELGMEPGQIKESELTYEQRCVVEIYKELKRTGNKFFALKNNFTEEDIDDAISETIKLTVGSGTKGDTSEIRGDSIIIHGIHQFSPIMLKTIEALSKYKLVVILFNYQLEYKSVYQTWLDVYSLFESKVVISSKDFSDDRESFQGGRAANNIAALIGGNTCSIDFAEKIEVVEYNNATEFAGYIAKLFEGAERARRDENFAHPALYYMDEQIYAANSAVNDILKIYFPEQFGERDFLDYPIGHFFLAITKMWDLETQSLYIRDLRDIYECLSCGIITERVPGECVSIFDKARLFFPSETTISGIIKKLRRLKRQFRDINDDGAERAECQRIEYFDLSESEIDKLIIALMDLNGIAELFYADFNDQNNDFKVFYGKIREVLVSHVLDARDIDDEFKDIVQRVLCRIEEVGNSEANASFDCLRDTMQLYLRQVPGEGRGAKWIVRNFEQIDGDILRKKSNTQKRIHHFACLSDQDMSISHRDEFPWPLDIDFFEVAQSPVDWKYQVFVTSRLEYKNFRRYALIYGLAFSRCPVKLSYIKNRGENTSELYYLFNALNVEIKPYEPDVPIGYKQRGEYIEIRDYGMAKFSKYDLMRYNLCKYRFLLESIIEERSVYKDEFLLKRYLKVLLEHRARRHFSGKVFASDIVSDYLRDQLEDLKPKFGFVNYAETWDIIKSAREYLEKYALYHGRFVQIREEQMDHMTKRENFLATKLAGNLTAHEGEIFKNSTQEEIDHTLNKENLSDEKYRKVLNSLCGNCSEKDICLESFRFKMREKKGNYND